MSKETSSQSTHSIYTSSRKLSGKKQLLHWRKPPEGWYKLNTDGASKGNPGISGAGGILRDQLGKVIFAFQEPLGSATNTQAELSAIHRGLQICFSRGLRKIWIETDATAIIKLISAPQRGHGTFRRLSKTFVRFLAKWSTNFPISLEKAIKWRISSQIKHATYNNCAYLMRKLSQVKLKVWPLLTLRVSLSSLKILFFYLAREDDCWHIDFWYDVNDDSSYLTALLLHTCCHITAIVMDHELLRSVVVYILFSRTFLRRALKTRRNRSTKNSKLNILNR
ncbi:UNVERIFIED_CONTAM: putative ribonuclease H protein [Sesamum radiatum]|uniref:Ribonuclease H protein n=1 Tax=Sesamum radiatum TaxID=300843 RepID=A0AAW2JJD7_SESRA